MLVCAISYSLSTCHGSQMQGNHCREIAPPCPSCSVTPVCTEFTHCSLLQEKRKRDAGQATSSKNYVEEEKRLARQHGVYSGFDT